MMEIKKTFFEKEAFQITILIFMPIFSFLYFLDSFIFPKATHYSDYTISHFPNLIYLQNALQSGQGLPLWNSQILSGFPALANPLSGIWYPGNWLSVQFPLPQGSHLITVLHLIVGGIGMYLFLRKQEFSTFSALFGALAFQMMPKLFAHYAAGHISLVQAITYTPWLLYLQQMKDLRSNRKWLYLATAILYTMVILCDIRWVAYLLIIDLIFFINFFRNLESRSIKTFGKHLLLRVIPVGLGVLISSFYIFPFMEYVNLTDRSLLKATDILNYSLPIGKIIGFIVPDMGGYAEYIIYPGIVIWITFLGIFTIKSLRKKSIIIVVSIGLLMLFSFGSYLPFMEWIARIPGINLLRVPSRMYFLVSMLMIYLSAAYLSEIQVTENPKKEINLLPQFFTLIFASAIMGIIIFSGDVLISDFYWPVIMSLLVFLVFIVRKNTNRFRGLVQFFLIILCVIDLTIINSSQYDIYTEDMVLDIDSEIIELIKPTQNDLHRIYSPSYSVEQHISAVNSLSLATGIDPLHLASYAQFMEKASGVPQNGYSVTIPSYKSGNVREDNKEAIPDTELLGLLNVRYFVSYFPIPGNNLEEINQINGTYVYENPDYLPRAWVENDGEKILSNVQNIVIEPNKIIIDAIGPGKLVLSEIDYPGWKATNNGQKSDIEPAYDILRSIHLNAGENHIELKFLPQTLITGSIISIIVLIATIFFFVFYKGNQVVHE